MASILISMTLSGAALAQTIVQTFYIPFDEDEVNVALNTIDNFGGNIGSTLRSSISIVGGITNTHIYWDHWEDGYEGNIVAPTQTTTLIWGDNNPLNGIPPGFSADRIGEGDIITLLDDIQIPRDPGTMYHDSRDRVSVTRWVAISRYLYAPSPGEVLADSAQIYDRSKFGFEFRAPVGINTGTNQMFEYSAIHVSAGYDNTVVQIDTDADGIYDDTVFLNAGDNHVVRFTSQGARVTASKPIQSHMITGDINSNYEMRFFELFPREQWDSAYFASVHSIGSIATEVYLFNPNEQALDIFCETLSGTTLVSVAANNLGTFLMPTNSGARFYSTNGLLFIPVSATDARQAISGNQAYDWGHALVPLQSLTTASIVPWAPGAGGNPLSSYNGNPIWVTAQSNTTLYVDLDGNSTTGPLIDPYGRRYNYSTNLSRLQSVRISDNNDHDQTGMRIYTLNEIKFATVWGQDPSVAQPGNPYLDMGAAVFPFPTVPAVKDWEMVEDMNTNGLVNPGDIIKFTIQVVNVGYSDANNVKVYDTGASNTAYQLSSLVVNGTNMPDDTVPPALTVFPLDEYGLNVGTIRIGQTATVSYVVTVDDPFPTNTDGIVNGVYVDNQTQVYVPVPMPGFAISKSSPTNLLNPGDLITYTVDIISTANVHQSGVQVNDQLPATITYVTNSTRVVVDGDFTGSFLDSFTVVDEFNGNNGALYWKSDWIEVGEANGAGAGDIQVVSDTGAPENIYMLRVQNANRGAYRLADIRQFTNAALSFSYRRESMDSGDSVSVSVSTNGGSNWITLTNLAGAATDAGYLAVSNIPVTQYRSTNFAVRFLANGVMDTSDRVWIDDVGLSVSGRSVTNVGGAPPLLISNYGVGSGQTVRITFSATVNGGISVSSVVNRVYVNSHASPAPVEASVTNIVLLPERSRIAGWVRNDLDGLGDTEVLYPGISGVAITLYTDPNGDGNPADGVIVASGSSDTNGFFDLGYFLSNQYVILQTDLVNFRSTADSDGDNPNLISLSTFSGQDYMDNIFLDTRLSTVSGWIRYDLDGDGDVTDPDSGIAGVNVLLYSDPNGDGNPADGSMVSSKVSSVSGEFIFGNVTTGHFVLVESDPAGLLSTGDSDGVNDNRMAVYNPGGLDSTNHVFLDTGTGLSITKSSSPAGIWYPNLQVTYTITVVNTGVYTHTGIYVVDTMSSGLAYIPGSVSIEGEASSYVTYIYTNVGTHSFTPPDGVNEVEYLVVGGGGGGGGISSGSVGGAGGGGAGGYLSNVGGIGYPVTSQSYTVIVGGGGSGGVGGSSPGANGGSSTFDTITAAGGGGGASPGNNNGVDGGSGGGGRLNSSGLGGSGTAGQGNSGGDGASSGSSAGGGGGASLDGANGATSGVGGAGGAGLTNRISGVWSAYAGGGGGGGYGASGGSGGLGGGASAPSSRAAGNNGEANTGGGGSGATGSSSGNAFTGGNGGSGIVIIRHRSGAFGTPPDLMSDHTMGPGDSITITFTAEVFAVSSVSNTACLTSDIITNPMCATVVNSVATGASPDRISGRVLFDVGGDGVIQVGDFGLPGVTVEVHTDPNGDGLPADGELLDATVTDSSGYFIFGNLSSGDYVLVEHDLPGYTSTGDSDGDNNGYIAVHLAGDEDSSGHAFLDWTISGLTIHKTCSSEDIVVPGEKLQYSIVVSNARNVDASGILIYDALPEGMGYVSSSTWMVVSGINVDHSVQDLFQSRTYTNQDGSEKWISNWIESGDDASPIYGDIAIESDLGLYRLRIRDDSRSIRRRADISGGSYATLSYFYRRSGLELGEYVMVEISTNDSSPWTELARHSYEAGGSSSQSDGSYQYVSIDVTEYAGTNTTLRFRSPAGGMSDGDIVYFYDVRFDYGYSLSQSTNGPPLPLLTTNLTLTPGAFVTITYTAEVISASTIINTAIVYTASDTNGLRSLTTNIVGDIALIQGKVVTASNSETGVAIEWSAYTNESGDVIKDYEVMYIDDQTTGFNPDYTNLWECAAEVQDSVMIDTGNESRPSPSALGKRMRFYRASFKGSWDPERPKRFASKEVYVAKTITLKEGENFVSLFMIPDQNKLSEIMGTNRLPAGSTMGNATRIEWYSSSAESEPTNIVWLSTAGVWQHETGGIANDMPMPLSKGFNVVVPAGAGEQNLVLVGRVPTNATPGQGHAPEIVANESYSVVSYNVPYRIKLKDSGLKESGFTGVPSGYSFNPRYSDELRILKKGGGSLTQPQIRILMNSAGQFYYWTGGAGVADNHYLEPDDALIIYTKMSKSNFTWNINLPYPEPTLFMTP